MYMRQTATPTPTESFATIIKGTSMNPEAKGSFEKQLEAMEKAGLNLSLFRDWLSDDGEGIQWPHGFFQERFLLAQSEYKNRLPDSR